MLCVPLLSMGGGQLLCLRPPCLLWTWVQGEGLVLEGMPSTAAGSGLWDPGCARGTFTVGVGEWTLLQSVCVGSSEQGLAAGLQRPLRVAEGWPAGEYCVCPCRAGSQQHGAWMGCSVGRWEQGVGLEGLGRRVVGRERHREEWEMPARGTGNPERGGCTEERAEQWGKEGMRAE